MVTHGSVATEVRLANEPQVSRGGALGVRSDDCGACRANAENLLTNLTPLAALGISGVGGHCQSQITWELMREPEKIVTLERNVGWPTKKTVW